MKFPPYWAKGQSGDFACWRWSWESLAEAESRAREAACQLAHQFEAGFPPQRRGYYPDRPPREQVLREIKNASGKLLAVISRNSYGSQVLNTEDVMFVDIDVPETPRRGAFWSWLTGKPKDQPAPAAQALEKVEAWTKTQPDWGWRIYRTRSGLRLMATHALVPVKSGIVQQVFEAVGADPLYRKLCTTQESFRARLTPKHWRIGLNRRPERWPWVDSKAAERFRAWQADYERKSAAWASCAFIRKLGRAWVHPEVEPVLRLHDEITQAESGKDLG